MLSQNLLKASSTMMSANASFLQKMVMATAVPARDFSVAYNVKSKFEAAFQKKLEYKLLGQGAKKTRAHYNQYGQGFYQENIKNMRQGYVHPYHSERYPLVFSYYGYMKTLFEAVSNIKLHYESLSRSRRVQLLQFFYIGTINTTRHFTYFLGPKFTTFYNVYTRYETQQLSMHSHQANATFQNEKRAARIKQLKQHEYDLQRRDNNYRQLLNCIFSCQHAQNNLKLLLNTEPT